MNLSYQIEQVAYWLDEKESAENIHSRQIAKDLTLAEIQKIEDDYRSFKCSYIPPRPPKESTRSLVVGVILMLVGCFKMAIKGGYYGIISLGVGAVMVIIWFVSAAGNNNDESDQEYNIRRGQILDNLADEFERNRREAATTI